MPTYVYECAKCGDEFELWQSFSDEPLKRHRGGCGGKVTKVIQPAGIVLKGSGFYKNDSRSNSKASTREKSDTGSSGGDSKSDSSKSDSSKSDSSSSNGASQSSKSDTSTKSGAAASK
jgi:putative FmdB family regulatory protein